MLPKTRKRRIPITNNCLVSYLLVVRIEKVLQIVI